MEKNQTYREDMIAAWLKREDKVSDKGTPTWENLINALKQPVIGHTGIATMIAEDKGLNC